MKIKEQSFLKTISKITLFFFTSTSLAWGAPQGIVIVPGKETPSFLQIEIPEDLARIEEIYEAPARLDPKLILHIQNVHGNYEAQVQIKKLLEYLHQKYAFKLLFAEGAVEKLNPEYLNLFPERERNLELADYLARQGELTGIEYYLISGPKDVEAVGIEKAELYRKNYEAFKKVYEVRSEVDQFLNQFGQKLEMLSSRIFPPDTRRVLSEWKKFEAGHRDFLPFVKRLAEDAKKVTGLDLESLFAQVEWPQITRLLVLQSMEADLNRAQAEKEQARLIEFLKFKRIPKEIVEAIGKLGAKHITMSRLDEKDKRLEDLPRYLLERLVEEAGPKGFYFHDYPAFSLWAGYLILQAELDSRVLFEEIERVFKKVLDELTVTELEKNLMELFRDAELLRKLLHLEVTRKEWDRVVYRKDWIQPKAVWGRLEKVNEEMGPGASLFKELGEIKTSEVISTFETALEFYEFARERESVFYETIQVEMTKRKTEKAVLVTGGFHTEGLMEIFRERQINYSILTPRLLQQIDNSNYISSMLENRPTMFDLANIERANTIQRWSVLEGMGRSRRSEVKRMIDAWVATVQQTRDNKKYLQDLGRLAEYFNSSDYASPVEKGGRGVQLVRSETRNTYQVLLDGSPLTNEGGAALEIPIDKAGLPSPFVRLGESTVRSEARSKPSSEDIDSHLSRAEELIRFAQVKVEEQDFIQALLNSSEAQLALRKIERGNLTDIQEERRSRLWSQITAISDQNLAYFRDNLPRSELRSANSGQVRQEEISAGDGGLGSSQRRSSQGTTTSQKAKPEVPRADSSYELSVRVSANGAGANVARSSLPDKSPARSEQRLLKKIAFLYSSSLSWLSGWIKNPEIINMTKRAAIASLPAIGMSLKKVVATAPAPWSLARSISVFASNFLRSLVKIIVSTLTRLLSQVNSTFGPDRFTARLADRLPLPATEPLAGKPADESVAGRGESTVRSEARSRPSSEDIDGHLSRAEELIRFAQVKVEEQDFIQAILNSSEAQLALRKIERGNLTDIQEERRSRLWSQITAISDQNSAYFRDNLPRSEVRQERGEGRGEREGEERTTKTVFGGGVLGFARQGNTGTQKLSQWLQRQSIFLRSWLFPFPVINSEDNPDQAHINDTADNERSQLEAPGGQKSARDNEGAKDDRAGIYRDFLNRVQLFIVQIFHRAASSLEYLRDASLAAIWQLVNNIIQFIQSKPQAAGRRLQAQKRDLQLGAGSLQPDSPRSEVRAKEELEAGSAKFEGNLPTSSFERRTRGEVASRSEVRGIIKSALVVDDDKGVRDFLARMLNIAAGIPEGNIAVAEDGTEALKIMEGRAFDIVFTDGQMPRMDGIPFVKQASPLYPGTLFVLLSGDENTRKQAVAELQGLVLGVLPKPSPLPQILDLLKKGEALLLLKSLPDEIEAARLIPPSDTQREQGFFARPGDTVKISLTRFKDPRLLSEVPDDLAAIQIAALVSGIRESLAGVVENEHVQSVLQIAQQLSNLAESLRSSASQPGGRSELRAGVRLERVALDDLLEQELQIPTGVNTTRTVPALRDQFDIKIQDNQGNDLQDAVLPDKFKIVVSLPKGTDLSTDDLRAKAARLLYDSVFAFLPLAKAEWPEYLVLVQGPGTEITHISFRRLQPRSEARAVAWKELKPGDEPLTVTINPTQGAKRILIRTAPNGPVNYVFEAGPDGVRYWSWPEPLYLTGRKAIADPMTTPPPATREHRFNLSKSLVVGNDVGIKTTGEEFQTKTPYRPETLPDPNLQPRHFSVSIKPVKAGEVTTAYDVTVQHVAPELETSTLVGGILTSPDELSGPSTEPRSEVRENLSFSEFLSERLRQVEGGRAILDVSQWLRQKQASVSTLSKEGLRIVGKIFYEFLEEYKDNSYNPFGRRGGPLNPDWSFDQWVGFRIDFFGGAEGESMRIRKWQRRGAKKISEVTFSKTATEPEPTLLETIDFLLALDRIVDRQRESEIESSEESLRQVKILWAYTGGVLLSLAAGLVVAFSMRSFPASLYTFLPFVAISGALLAALIYRSMFGYEMETKTLIRNFAKAHPPTPARQSSSDGRSEVRNVPPTDQDLREQVQEQISLLRRLWKDYYGSNAKRKGERQLMKPVRSGKYADVAKSIDKTKDRIWALLKFSHDGGQPLDPARQIKDLLAKAEGNAISHKHTNLQFKKIVEELVPQLQLARSEVRTQAVNWDRVAEIARTGALEDRERLLKLLVTAARHLGFFPNPNGKSPLDLLVTPSNEHITPGDRQSFEEIIEQRPELTAEQLGKVMGEAIKYAIQKAMGNPSAALVEQYYQVEFLDGDRQDAYKEIIEQITTAGQGAESRSELRMEKAPVPAIDETKLQQFIISIQQLSVKDVAEGVKDNEGKPVPVIQAIRALVTSSQSDILRTLPLLKQISNPDNQRSLNGIKALASSYAPGRNNGAIKALYQLLSKAKLLNEDGSLKTSPASPAGVRSEARTEKTSWEARELGAREKDFPAFQLSSSQPPASSVDFRSEVRRFQLEEKNWKGLVLVAAADRRLETGKPLVDAEGRIKSFLETVQTFVKTMNFSKKLMPQTINLAVQSIVQTIKFIVQAAYLALKRVETAFNTLKARGYKLFKEGPQISSHSVETIPSASPSVNVGLGPSRSEVRSTLRQRSLADRSGQSAESNDVGLSKGQRPASKSEVRVERKEIKRGTKLIPGETYVWNEANGIGLFIQGKLNGRDPEVEIQFYDESGKLERKPLKLGEFSLFQSPKDKLYVASQEDVEELQRKIAHQASIPKPDLKKMWTDLKDKIPPILKMRNPYSIPYIPLGEFWIIEAASRSPGFAIPEDVYNLKTSIDQFWRKLSKRQKGELSFWTATAVERLVIATLFKQAFEGRLRGKQMPVVESLKRRLNKLKREDVIDAIRSMLDIHKHIRLELVEQVVKEQGLPSRRSDYVSNWLQTWSQSEINDWIRNSVPYVERILEHEYPEAGIVPRPFASQVPPIERIGRAGEIATDYRITETASLSQIIGSILQLQGRSRNEVSEILEHTGPDTHRVLLPTQELQLPKGTEITIVFSPRSEVRKEQLQAARLPARQASRRLQAEIQKPEPAAGSLEPAAELGRVEAAATVELARGIKATVGTLSPEEVAARQRVYDEAAGDVTPTLTQTGAEAAGGLNALLQRLPENVRGVSFGQPDLEAVSRLPIGQQILALVRGIVAEPSAQAAETLVDYAKLMTPLNPYLEALQPAIASFPQILTPSDDPGLLVLVTGKVPSREAFVSLRALLLTQKNQYFRLIFPKGAISAGQMRELQIIIEDIFASFKAEIANRFAIQEVKKREELMNIPRQVYALMKRAGVNTIANVQALQQNNFVQWFDESVYSFNLDFDTYADPYSKIIQSRLQAEKADDYSALVVFGAAAGMKLSQRIQAAKLDERTVEALKANGRFFQYIVTDALREFAANLVKALRAELRLKSAA